MKIGLLAHCLFFAGIGAPAVCGACALSEDLVHWLKQYQEDRESLRRSYSVPMSTPGAERFARFYRDWLDRVQELNFAELDHDRQVDAILFRNHLDVALRRLQRERERDAVIQPLLPFAQDAVVILEQHQRMEPVNPRATAESLADLCTAIQERLEQGFENDAALRPAANHAARRLEELKRAFSEWYGFYDGYDPIFSWWVQKPYTRFSKALAEYTAKLKQDLIGIAEDDEATIVGDPIGRKALLDELAAEMIPYSPNELIEIANREYAWCEAEMLKASNELGFGDAWREALEYVKARHVAPGEQPMMIKELALEVIAFLEDRDLLTIPDLCKETWRMRMMSPERQRMSPYFLGGEVIIISFPTDTMTHEEKLMSMRGNNVHFARATVHHELIPGHHLQGFMTRRNQTHRSLFRTPFWVEGWALYWEMQLWDLGFPETPEDRIGMLFWRMHRCLRIIFSLGFHLGTMTPAEAVDLLVERVGHERRNAAAEVRRSVAGGYGPLYQAAYMLGGLQIRSLYRSLVERGAMTPREFHDQILKQNAIPIAMVRAALTNQELDFTELPRWRFYELD